MALDYYTALDTGQPWPYLSRNTEGRGVMVGYCFKCKAKRSLKGHCTGEDAERPGQDPGTLSGLQHQDINTGQGMTPGPVKTEQLLPVTALAIRRIL